MFTIQQAKWILAVLVTTTPLLFASPKQAAAQAAMRESLERLDTNGNGRIDPNEVTSISRPFLERIEKATRVEIADSDSIERWMAAIEEYYSQEQEDRSRRPQTSSSEGMVKPFGTEEGDTILPDFGSGEIRYPFTKRDLEVADWIIRRYDANRDQMLDRSEAAEARWLDSNAFNVDFNKDGRLSRHELAQNAARTRSVESDEEMLQDRRRDAILSRRASTSDSRRERSRDWARRGGIDFWLTSNLVERFDENRNGVLESDEYEELAMPISEIDVNRDTQLDRDELFNYLYKQQELVTQYEEGIPGWFYEKDLNEDDQIQMSEFATAEEWSDEKIAEFESLDLNRDGLLTTKEILDSSANVGGTYKSEDAELIPPKKTIISEIEIPDDVRIRDLDVQISITHSYASHLDVFLNGPNGERVELFTEVGGSDDNFEGTIFDDESSNRIDKARPPFADRFRPEGTLRGEKGLSQFNGQSAEGVWQLVVRATRSERFGMLHSWSLQIQPIEE